jgi:hypothetical protein
MDEHRAVSVPESMKSAVRDLEFSQQRSQVITHDILCDPRIASAANKNQTVSVWLPALQMLSQNG